MTELPTSKTVTKQVEEGMRLRHAEVERASDKLGTAGAMAYLSHLDRGELFEEVERLRNALSQSVETVKRLMAESRPVETSPEQPVWGLESRHEDGDWLTYYALYPTRAQAQTAAGNGRPVGVEWRVVEYRKVSAVEPTPRREYHANGTYWSGVPTVDMPCDFCTLPITDHDPRTHACPPEKASDG